jgi:spermidine synthase
LEPLSYYSRFGGMGEALTALGKAKKAPKVALVGLGIGSLLCYGTPSWHFTLYEIDPAVVDVARDKPYFSFMKKCGSPYDVVLGDGRLTINRAGDGAYDVIVLDAFSSDVIPVHLLTREALELYVSKLSPKGFIVVHLSNRYLYLSPTVARTAAELGLSSLQRVAPAGTIPGTKLPYYGSIVMALARKPEDLRILSKVPGWKQPEIRKDVAAWTDDYSNLLQPFLMGRR